MWNFKGRVKVDVTFLEIAFDLEGQPTHFHSYFWARVLHYYHKYSKYKTKKAEIKSAEIKTEPPKNKINSIIEALVSRDYAWN